jgi:hypothetical protein
MEIERIAAAGETLALLVRASTRPQETTFVTAPEAGQQVGFVVYPAGGEIGRHRHVDVHREVTGTGEVLIVREGACEIDLFDRAGEHVATRPLAAGDLIVLSSGGHGFRMQKDTVLLEVKQGPYMGLQEKEYF